MKICVVTVYDSINSGSFWQAYALGQVLKMQGHNVYFYKRGKNGASSSLAIQAKTIIQLLFRLQIAEACNYIRMLRLFTKAKSNFAVIDPTSTVYKEIDRFILGSDTIWNLNSEYFRRYRNIFWGDAFYGRKVISYGGSIANTEASAFNDCCFHNSIKRWNAVSVRDEHTKDVFSNLINRTIHIVCDPTLLLTESYYKGICKPQTGNYIFLYIFKKLNINHDKQLREFADMNNLTIISGTKKGISTETDELVTNGPYNFMKYMLGAKYIVTDTYHGTVFSTNFNKQFIVINHKLMKINDFLSTVGLTSRIISENSSFMDTITSPINYSHTNKIIEEIRQNSIEFLYSKLK